MMAKYQIIASYVFTKEYAIVEAESEEDALRKIEEMDIIEQDYPLCFACEEKIMEHPVLIEENIKAVEIENGRIL